jgi:hypothetical protein
MFVDATDRLCTRVKQCRAANQPADIDPEHITITYVAYKHTNRCTPRPNQLLLDRLKSGFYTKQAVKRKEL